MAKQRARNMPDGEDDGIRILGFTEHEVELVLMSVQCIKRSKRSTVGWEIGMKDLADLTNTSISDARVQWKDLSSRLMKLPRLPSKIPSPEERDESEEIIEECIIVKDEMGDVSSGDSDDGKVKTKTKGKQVAKPSVLDSIGISHEVEDEVEATNKAEVKRSRNGIAMPSAIKDRTKRAWADIGDGMTEDKWNEMGDKLAL